MGPKKEKPIVRLPPLSFDEFRSNARRDGILTCDNAFMDRTFKDAHQASLDNNPVLITGKSGTGKSLVASCIHSQGIRRLGPFTAVNCAAYPETLLDSELFGYKKGAFTGATEDREGLFKAACGGTLFLDEIGDASPAFQAKLLRVLETGAFFPVGSIEEVRTDVRVIGATNKGIESIRRDLVMRFRNHSIHLPDLFDRKDDILLIFLVFFERFLRTDIEQVQAIDADLLDFMVWYPWPGNVRELINFASYFAREFRPPVISYGLLWRFFPHVETWDKKEFEILKTAIPSFSFPDDLAPSDFFRSPFFVASDSIVRRRHPVMMFKGNVSDDELDGRLPQFQPSDPFLYRIWPQLYSEFIRRQLGDKDGSFTAYRRVLLKYSGMKSMIMSVYEKSGGPPVQDVKNADNLQIITKRDFEKFKQCYHTSIMETLRRENGNIVRTAAIHGVSRDLVRRLKNENSDS